MTLLLILGAPAWLPLLVFTYATTAEVFHGFTGALRTRWSIGL